MNNNQTCPAHKYHTFYSNNFKCSLKRKEVQNKGDNNYKEDNCGKQVSHIFHS